MKRKCYLDYLRILAAVAVVIFHAWGNFVGEAAGVTPGFQKGIVAVTAGLQWHVPVFFMITGFLWLDDEKICTYRKMWGNIRRFVLVLFTVGFAYALMERVFLGAFSLATVLRSFAAVLTGDLWDHMWYLYSIIGVYLFLPVLKPFYAHNDKRTIGLFVGLLFLFTVLSPALTELFGYKFPVVFPVIAPAFYVCAGGLLAKLQGDWKKQGIFSLLVFLCSAVGAGLVSCFTAKGEGLISVLNCVSAVSLFFGVKAVLDEGKESRWVRTLSDSTFGIYLIHPFFIHLMEKVLHIYPARWMPPVSFLLATVGITGVSFGVIYLLRKIGPVKKYLL